ncbi:MAG: alpha-glutamyl/putrescinyl thymine pyrophosphorylase clade 3 protein [Nitrospiria bacterium]
MRPKEGSLAKQLDLQLRRFNRSKYPLPGILATSSRQAFIEQLVESIRRIRYISVIKKHGISVGRADPSSQLFDPLKAAILCQHQGQIDEAFWLVFLFVYFGKNRGTGWRLARDIYGALGSTNHWNWSRTSADPEGFRRWLAENQVTLKGGDGILRKFGNHRKYETLKTTSTRGTGSAVESYVKWVCPPRTHQMLVNEAKKQVGRDPRKIFSYLYDSMNIVVSFGRTAKFDYLTTVGKLDLAPIEPGSTFMEGATGPLKGARLLFGKSVTSAKDLDEQLVHLEAHLKLYFGMQVLEDALCNWQKSPKKFKPFRG